MVNLQTLLSKLDGKISYPEGHSIAIHQGLDLVSSTGSGLARVKPEQVAMTSLIRMESVGNISTLRRREPPPWPSSAA